MTKDKLKNLSLLLLLIVSVLLVWDGCNKRAEVSAFKKQVSSLGLSNKAFKQRINDQKQTLVEQEQTILTQKDAIKLGLLEIDRLKKVKSQVRIQSVVDIDSIFVPYLQTKTDTIILNQFASRQFGISDTFYSIYGKTIEKGLLIDSISFNNSLSITIANKKDGIFKKSKPVVSVVYDNPYVKVNKMDNVIVKDENKFFTRKSTYFGLGLGLGILGTAILLK